MPSVLFVHASTDLYGSDLACLRALEGAQRAGWRVEIVLPGAGPLEDELLRRGVTVHTLDPLKPRRADLTARRLPAAARRWTANLRRVRRLSRTSRFDVVYTTTAPTLGGSLLARSWRAGHVYHVHEIFWYPRPIVRMFARLVGRADIVLCCSRAVADQFRHLGLGDRLRVTYTGVDVPASTPESTPLSNVVPRIICVARLNEWKGQEVLIRAVADVRARGYDVRLSLVGGVYADQHHFREALESLVGQLGLSAVVELLGDRRDALSLVGQSDIFVLPSRRPEPFGMALVEAMALGRPVVATNAGGPSEIVTSGVDGLLVPMGDAPALANAVVQLLADPEGARVMAERGRARAQHFDAESMVAEVVRALDEAMLRAHDSS